MAVDGIRAAGGASTVGTGLAEDYREELLRRLRERKREMHQRRRPAAGRPQDDGAGALRV